MRSFVEYTESLRNTLGLGDTDGIGKALREALDATEAEIGGPLLKSNSAGVASFLEKLADAEGALDMDTSDEAAMNALMGESMLESIKGEIGELKEAQKETERKIASLV